MPFISDISQLCFWFGTSQHRVPGSIFIRMLNSDRENIVLKVHVVNFNILFLVAFDTLRKVQNECGHVWNKIWFQSLNIDVSLTRRNGHMYLGCYKSGTASITFPSLSTSQSFFTSSQWQIFEIVTTFASFKVDIETIPSLINIVTHCKNCQCYGSALIRSKLSIPIEKVPVFGDEISFNQIF